MAALWVVGGLVVGVLVTYLVMSQQASRERAMDLDRMGALERLYMSRLPVAEGRAPDRPIMSEAVQAKMMERLLDAALPEREEPPREEPVQSPGEYEPPSVEVSDWTDPFFGLERDVVGGLAPGQPIPGIGAEDDYSTYPTVVHGGPGGPGIEFIGHPLANGYTPDDDAARDGWRDVGDELFDAWQGADEAGGS